MILGDIVKTDFTVINVKEEPVQNIGTDTSSNLSVKNCCYELPVFWSDEMNDFQNDKSDYIYFAENTVVGCNLHLQKYNGIDFEDITILNNNDFGTYYNFGFIQNQFSQKAIGVLIDWKLVYESFGDGNYRVKNTVYELFSTSKSLFSFEYCLRKYTKERADFTVRFDTVFNGVYAINNRYIDFKDSNWTGSIRIPNSVVKDPKSSYEKEFVRYQNGEQVWIKDEQKETYKANIYSAPSFVHSYFKTMVLQADSILVTDYNLLNPNKVINLDVIFNSSYEPNWVDNVMFASCEFSLEEKFIRKIKKRC
jgi:hypothetical protein